MCEKSALCLCGMFTIVRGLEDCRWIPPAVSFVLLKVSGKAFEKKWLGFSIQKQHSSRKKAAQHDGSPHYF